MHWSHILLHATLTVLVAHGPIVSEARSYVTPAWIARYDGPASGYDQATGLATDRDGNIYVTGTSTMSSSNRDVATVKYAPDGTQRWVQQYDGPGNSYDYAVDIATDSSGNVYVAGSSYGADTDLDFAIMKYDTHGNQLWAARYNGGDAGSDMVTAMAVDNADNVYITGYSSGLGTSYVYTTVKYDPTGNQVWVAHYDGLGAYGSAATAIAVDEHGNTYVTGNASTPTSDDYTTVKYDVQGKQVWVQAYDGPGNGLDYARAITIGPDGNIYVGGYSRGEHTEYDYALVTYDTNGTPRWVARYNGPSNTSDYLDALVVDSDGNIYVTGDSYQHAVTIKYDPHGTQLWTARYTTSGTGSAGGNALLVDRTGNVYVAGEAILWGEMSSTSNALTLKYNADGTLLWEQMYDGPAGGRDTAQAITSDQDGNIYIAGTSDGGSNTGSDFVTIHVVQAHTVLAPLVSQ
jgi:uncharacterized delta-60 repeat protein